jgi:hypothetical protein
MIECMKIQIGENVSHAERTRSVARAGLDEHRDDALPDIIGLYS